VLGEAVSDRPVVTRSQLVRDLRAPGLASGNGPTGKVGAGQSYLFEAAPLLEFAVG